MSADEQHEADLARLIAGELAPESPAGKAALEAAGMSLEDLNGLRKLAGELDAASAVRDAIGAAAGTIEDAPGIDRVAPTLESLAAGSRRRGFRLDWLLPLAALVLIAPLAWRWLSPPAEQLLGDFGVSVTLGASGDSYGSVEFEVHDPQPGDELALLVFAGEDPVHLEPLFEYPLGESPWSIPEEQARWPDRVHIRVEVRRLGHPTAPYGTAECSRR